MRGAINPYTNRSAIREPSDFFGRTRELQDIYTRIQGFQSVSLVGERRIGKSSLLNALKFEQSDFDIPDIFSFVFIDAQSILDCTETTFVEYLLGQISEETGILMGEPTRASLQAAAREIRRQERFLVILIDEFDTLVFNELLSQEFFSFLRSWTTRFQVSFVVASREGSIDPLAENPRLGSYFMNIFGTIYVGPFTEDEAKELIITPAAEKGVVFEKEEIEWVLDLAGFFPLFLQVACYHLFDLRQSGAAKEQARSTLETNFTFEIKPYLEYLWKRLPEDEQGELVWWANNGYTQSEYARKGLLRKGILIERPTGARIFSRIFKDMVLSKSVSNKRSFYVR